MRPSDLVGDPKLAQRVIGVYEAAARCVEIDQRTNSLGHKTRGCGGEGPEWEMFNASYSAWADAWAELRARVLKVGTR